MKIEFQVQVTRDDGTVLSRTERFGNESLWVLAQRRRLTRIEVRKVIDVRIKAALNATLGGQR